MCFCRRGILLGNIFFPLPRIPCKKEFINIVDDRRFFATPQGSKEVICHAVARQARDNCVGRQQFNGICHEADVVFPFKRCVFTAIIHLCQTRIFEDV